MSRWHPIRVVFPGSQKMYAYNDPSGNVKIGDYVIVDTADGDQTVWVAAKGRGGYDGHLRNIANWEDFVDREVADE